MDFEILSSKKAFKYYKKLYSQTKKSFYTYNNFDFFNLKLYKADFLLLKNRYYTKVFIVFDEKKNPRAMATYYVAKDKFRYQIESSLGAFLFADDIKDEELVFFKSRIKENVQDETLFPMNAHFNLGFSTPQGSLDFSKLTYLTSSTTDSARRFFSLFKENKERTFHALSLDINNTSSIIYRLQESLKDCPEEISQRTISFRHFKRDIEIYNNLINETFEDHYKFDPLTFEEQWDLMKAARLIINKETFRFLLHNNKPIGVSWFLPDYNQVLTNGSDVHNFIRILKTSYTQRARGIHSCILKDYRGKKLLKYARNVNLLHLIKNGTEVIESSYIDEMNENSLYNVMSTGAKLSHSFDLYKI